MMRGFFTTFLIKQRRGRLGLGNASLGLGLLEMFIVLGLTHCKDRTFTFRKGCCPPHIQRNKNRGGNRCSLRRRFDCNRARTPVGRVGLPGANGAQALFPQFGFSYPQAVPPSPPTTTPKNGYRGCRRSGTTINPHQPP